jgi:hypothetical protein
MTTPAQPPEWAYHLDQPPPDQPYTLGNLMPQPTAPATPPAPNQKPVDRTLAWVVISAGAGIILASFLPWAAVSAPVIGTRYVAGTDGSDGWIAAAVGLFVVCVGVAGLRGVLTHLASTAAGTAAALGGLGVAGLAVWTIVDLQSRVADLRAQVAGSAGDDELGIAARMADAISVEMGVGLWLLIGAGLVAAVCAGYGVVTRR